MSNFALPNGSEMAMWTHTPAYEFTFKWVIEKYSKIPEKWTEISPEFSIEPQSTWRVEFEKDEDILYMFICRKQDTDFDVTYDTKITDFNNEILYSETGSESGAIKIDDLESLNSFQNDLFTSIPNDQLLITIVIKVERNSPITIKFERFSITPEMRFGQMEKLSKKMKNLLDQHIKTDLTLVVQKKRIVCHKAILAGMSPVFAKMFQEGMVEEDSSTVHIEDVSVSTVKALLSFMYSADVIEYDFDAALELYAAADKYEVLDLKDICGLCLASKVTLDKAFKVLYLADAHQDSGLKDRMLTFINLYYKPIEKELSLKY